MKMYTLNKMVILFQNKFFIGMPLQSLTGGIFQHV
jgi:hypothetical protein